MADKIIVPTLGESLTEATVAKWLKKVGDSVQMDEAIVELETDKVSVEVTAPKSGVISSIIAKEGSTVKVGGELGQVDTSAKAESGSKKVEASKTAPLKTEAQPIKTISKKDELSPAVKRIVEEKKIDISSVEGTGKDGRILKGDLVGLMGFSPSPNKKKN
jgi:2-oxoglutarate dehydrogenase E2 component (dihydrolipoamide succinyltransferase)